MFFCALPLGGSYRYRILRQKLSLDRRAHLGLQGGGLGRHAAAVSVSAKRVHRLCFWNWRPNSSLFLLPFRDSADRVVSENGQYEELIASSHEIAASTAQLVAASKVDGRRLFSFAHPAAFIPGFLNCAAALIAGEGRPQQQEAEHAPAGLTPRQRHGRRGGHLHQARTAADL